MKILTGLLFVSLVAAEAVFSSANAQKISSRPAPTGRIPSSGGQSAGQFNQYQPKPTGQIQPAVQATDPGAVQTPVPVVQEGQVPKVNTSQDPLTMPQRYQPSAGQATEQVIEVQQTTTTTPETQTNGANVQVETNVQSQRPANTTQPANTTVTRPATTNPTTTTPVTRQPVTQPAPTQTVP